MAEPEPQILHVDLDAFYASVEARDDPSLRGKPLIVGGHSRRGVVLAASYEVRPFGVRSAMSMAEAVRRAPQAIVVPPRFHAYAEASERVFAIFRSVTPEVEGLSLDEAFLDVTRSRALFGSGIEIAQAIRQRIREEVGLPASAGIAAAKFVAKIASDLAKPNGQLEVKAADTKAFLAKLPVARLWGVGPKTEARMRELGLYTLGDVAVARIEWLEAHLGDSGRHFWLLSQGIDDRRVEVDREAKSIGSEDTFEHDVRDKERLLSSIHSQALRVARRLRAGGVRARTVVLKLKTADFRLSTRRLTLGEPTDDGQVLYAAAESLLGDPGAIGPLRLTGVAAMNLEEEPAQLSLLGGKKDKAKKLNSTLDQITERFGTAAIVTADLVGEPEDPDPTLRAKIGASRLDAAVARKKRE
ncbi:MAG: DNA polymerase IV [Myxococcota bacterium]